MVGYRQVGVAAGAGRQGLPGQWELLASNKGTQECEAEGHMGMGMLLSQTRTCRRWWGRLSIFFASRPLFLPRSAQQVVGRQQ